MKYPYVVRGALLLCAALAGAVPSAAPVFKNEQLRYSINWPSGLSLGEAQLGATSSKGPEDSSGHFNFTFDIDAGVPGFSVSDRYRAQAVDDFCSSEFLRTTKHGPKKIDEKLTFDQSHNTVSRGAVGGEDTQTSASSCARDALTFLYYARRELSQGRIPATQTVFLGAQYKIRLEFAGTQSIRLADKPVEADRVTASAKGPASDISFEVFFLKDAARTPALVRVPLPLGTFSMELVQ
jgi:hypothetical protein